MISSPRGEPRLVDEVDHLDLVERLQVLLAQALEVVHRPQALGRLTCDVEPQVPHLVLRNRVGGLPGGSQRSRPGLHRAAVAGRDLERGGLLSEARRAREHFTEHVLTDGRAECRSRRRSRKRSPPEPASSGPTGRGTRGRKVCEPPVSTRMGCRALTGISPGSATHEPPAPSQASNRRVSDGTRTRDPPGPQPRAQHLDASPADVRA